MKIFRIVLFVITMILSFVTGFLCIEIPFYITLGLTIILLLPAFKVGTKRIVFSFIIPVFAIISCFYIGLFLKIKMPLVCAKGELKENIANWENIQPIDLNTINSKISKHSENFHFDSLSSVKYKDDEIAINILKSKDKKPNARTLLIVAGVHGSEPAGVFAIPEILDYINQHKLTEKFNIHLIPAINPVGLSIFNRHNECNCDINRDFKQFNTVQSQLLKKVFSAENYDLVIDLHEGLFSGHYIMSNNSQMTDAITNQLLSKQVRLSPTLTNPVKNFFYKYQFDNFLSDYSYTLSMLGYLKGKGPICIVSESDAQLNDMNKRVSNHLNVFEAAIKHLANNN